MIEQIKENIWKGGVGFSNSFPAIGHVVGAGLTIRLANNLFRNAKKKRR